MTATHRGSLHARRRAALVVASWLAGRALGAARPPSTASTTARASGRAGRAGTRRRRAGARLVERPHGSPPLRSFVRIVAETTATVCHRRSPSRCRAALPWWAVRCSPAAVAAPLRRVRARAVSARAGWAVGTRPATLVRRCPRLCCSLLVAVAGCSSRARRPGPAPEAHRRREEIELRDVVERASERSASTTTSADDPVGVRARRHPRARGDGAAHRDGWIDADKAAARRSLCVRSGHSRIPVIGENVDDVVGVVYLKDLVPPPVRTAAPGRPSTRPPSIAGAPAVFVPGLQAARRPAARDAAATPSTWRCWSTSTAPSPAWSPSRTCSRRSSARSPTSTTTRDRAVEDLGDGALPGVGAAGRRRPRRAVRRGVRRRRRRHRGRPAGPGARQGAAARSRGATVARPARWCAEQVSPTGRRRSGAAPAALAAPSRARRGPRGRRPSDARDAGPRTPQRARAPVSSQDREPPRRRPDDRSRSGFVCFVGRPNTGKSTLTNALVGAKVAITSNRPQTTRHTIRGIVHRADVQIILVDTPGLHRPRTLLGKRLNDLVATPTPRSTSSGCASRPTRRSAPATGGSSSRSATSHRGPRLVVVVTKIDKVAKDRVAAQLMAVGASSADVPPRSCRCRPPPASRSTC